jgi:pimeloyl-ACP methyl ester carboxylesterase
MFVKRGTLVIVGVVVATTLLVAPGTARSQAGQAAEAQPPRLAEPTRTGHIPINGLPYYYEVHGQGEPLLILHGGLGSTGMFDPILPRLAEGRQVIAVDLHGHGRTPLGDRPIHMPDIADDLAELLTALDLETVDVLGYSFGGGVGLRLAIQHPERVRRLVVVSAGYARDGYHPEMLPMQAEVGAAMAEAMRDTPMYRSYAAIAPNPEEFPRLLDRMGELMRQPYDWSEEVRTLRMPVMLVYGDSDMFRLEHIVRFYQLLGGGLRDAGWMREHMAQNRLAILPDLTHYETFFAQAMAEAVLPFLNGRRGVGSWEQHVQEGIR